MDPSLAQHKWGEQDGIFFMCWEHMIQYFFDIQLCMMNDKFAYSYRECTQERNSDYNLTKISVESDGQMTFSLYQFDKGCYQRSANYDYVCARLILISDKHMYIKGKMGLARDLHLEFEHLEAGEYYLFSEIDNMAQYQFNKYVIAAYGASSVKFGDDVSASNPKLDVLAQFMKV